MGPKATAQATPDQIAAMEDLKPEGRDTGHIVVTSADQKVLLDPNILQLHSHGVAAPHEIRQIGDESPASGKWEYEWGEGQIVYYVDDDNETLLPRYEKARRHRRPQAKRIASDIRAGRSLAEIVENASRG